MELTNLETQIASASWFRNLGAFRAQDRFFGIHDQQAWREYAEVGTASELAVRAPATHAGGDLDILAQMDWLPSSQSDPDPFHGDRLRQVDAEGNAELLHGHRARFSKLVMPAVRDVTGVGWLQVGPVNFTEVARQALIFAVRMAVTEILCRRPGVWCQCVGVYVGGNWACGRLPDNRIVVV